jgi:ABC-type uncharacterized transport system auxiliary subunit
MTTRRAAVAQLAWLTSGCSSLLAPVDTSTSVAMIDKLPDDIPKAVRSRGVLLVAMPTGREAYDTTRMAYSLRPHHLDFYARHEWAERPVQMLQPLLVRTLEAARCSSVVLATGAANVDYTLRTHVGELVQDFATEPPRVRLRLSIVLSARDKPLLAQEIEIAEAMRAKNAEAGVEAANNAVAKALRAVAQKVIDALA